MKKKEQISKKLELHNDYKASPASSPPPARFSNIRHEGKMNDFEDEDTADEHTGILKANNGTKLTDEFNFEAESGKDEDKYSYNDNDESSGNNDLEDEELRSIESGIAVGAGTSRENTPPSSPQLAQVRINSQLNQDTIGAFKGKSSANPNFIGEITEYYDIPFSDHTRTFRKRSKLSVKWKGADWNVMVGINDNSRVGFFLGFDKSDHLPNDWAVYFRFKFELLDSSDKVLRVKDVDHKFGKSYRNERVDNGVWGMFETDFLHNLCSNQRKNGFYTIKVRTIFEDICIPAVVPPGYNSKLVTGMVGLENLGATCYLNSLLQMLYHINSFRAAVYNLPHEGEVFEKSTTLALQSVFKNLQCSSKEVTTKDLTVAFGWTNAEAFMQQDVQEMMRVLIDKLEEKMKNTNLSGFIKDLFAGSIRSYIRCVNVPYESKRDEDFYDIQLDVKGCADIYDSFRKYTTNEMLDGENQYDAGSAYGKQDAQKGVIFTKFPPVLTIHLKRFDFDMVTMGFRKIHDYFSFPEILELDSFLAKDSPPESTAVPNVYALHSVLVHSGDVGGGHYYAYIRPSKNFKYSSLLNIFDGHIPADDVEGKQNAESAEAMLEGSDIHWFKFNDETVIQVESREAIQHCYGRKRGGENDGVRLMSSAYMLVYIRLSEAGRIMEDITIHDIPKDLLKRLNEESNTRKQFEMKVLREKMFTSLQFSTEEDVRNFINYSKVQDFLGEKNLTTLRIMKESTRLGALLLIANHLNENPVNLRMWILDRKKTSATLRLVDDVLVEDLDRNIKLERYYIQRLNPIDLPEDFLRTFEDLKTREQRWLDDLRKIISSSLSEAEDNSFFLGSEDNDLVEGCGIGMGNKPLQELRKVDVNIAQRLVEDMEDMTSQMMALLGRFHRDMAKDEVLIFFKAFDPWNALQIHDISSDSTDSHTGGTGSIDDSSSNSDSTYEGSDREETKKSDVYDVKTLDVDGVFPADGQVKRIVRKAETSELAANEYLPMKYIGCAIIKGDSNLLDLKNIVSVLLQGLAPANVPPIWLDSQGYRLFASDGPNSLISTDSFNKTSTIDVLLQTKDKTGRMVIVDIDPKIVKDYTAQLKFGLESPVDWFKYRTSRKTFIVAPFSPQDVDVLREMQCLYFSDNSKAKESATPSASDAQDDNPIVLAKKRSSAESVGDRRKTAGTTTEDSELLKGFIHKNSKFQIFLPTYMKVSSTIHLLAERLGVHANYLVLYFGLHDKNIAFSKQSARAAFPLHVGPIAGKDSKRFDIIEEVITHCLDVSNAVSRLMQRSFYIFFKISPFPLTSKGSKRLLDIKITDYRLRNWRQLYISHLRSLQAAAQLQSVTISPTTFSSNNDNDVSHPLGAEGEKNLQGSPNSLSNSAPKKRRKQTSPLDSAMSSGLPLSKHPPIVWPQITAEISAHTSILQEWCNTPNNIYISFDSKGRIEDLVKVIRQVISIPSNVNELLGDDTDLQNQQLLLRNNGEIIELLTAASSGPAPVVSDEIKVIYHKGPISTESSDDVAEAEARDSIEVESTTNTSMLEVLPYYPLVVYNIRQLMVEDILGAKEFVDNLVSTWSDCTFPFSNLYCIGIQHVTAEDMLFMLAKHPTVNSCIVSVFNFTLLGNSVNICSIDDFTGPFVSYIREDDTYYSVLQRFGYITGDTDKDWERCRLAVVRDKSPHFITRPNRAAPTGTADGTTVATEPLDEQVKQSVVVPKPTASAAKSVWTTLMDLYPDHAYNHCDLKAFVDPGYRGNERKYPTMGIQRSVSDIMQANKSKNRRFETGIKIV